MRAEILKMAFSLPPPCRRLSIQCRSYSSAASMCSRDRLPPMDNVGNLSVVAVGLVCIDFVGTVTNFPSPDAKIRTTSFAEFCGGNAANASVATVNLGIATKLISCVGDDGRGVTARESLRRSGVDVSGIPLIPGGVTPFTYIVVDETGGTRTCIHTPAQRISVPVDRLLIEDASVLMLDGRYPKAAVKYARIAHDNGVPILLDIERLREGTEELLQLCTGVVIKEPVALELQPEASTAEDYGALVSLLKRYSSLRWVVSTRGMEGCVLVHERPDGRVGDGDITASEMYGIGIRCTDISSGEYHCIYCEAQRGVKVVDSTGAGDAFFGALAFGVATKMPMRSTVALASVVGGASCEGAGAQSSPSRQDVVSFIEKLNESK